MTITLTLKRFRKIKLDEEEYEELKEYFTKNENINTYTPVPFYPNYPYYPWDRPIITYTTSGTEDTEIKTD